MIEDVIFDNISRHSINNDLYIQSMNNTFEHNEELIDINKQKIIKYINELYPSHYVDKCDINSYKLTKTEQFNMEFNRKTGFEILSAITLGTAIPFILAYQGIYWLRLTPKK